MKLGYLTNEPLCIKKHHFHSYYIESTIRVLTTILLHQQLKGSYKAYEGLFDKINSSFIIRNHGKSCTN